MIIDAIHDGTLAAASTGRDPVFQLEVPKSCPDVPAQLLQPRTTSAALQAYDRAARKLAGLFRDNFAMFADSVPGPMRKAGPS